ncbi:hypothetical protein [Streptomyces viridochromogenes]|uniref:hypothetical protein n=1 Tax=Streptomyces viridochromogenes TaxID=1938 RepID=UPI00131B2DD9|nr:hypothetical protein [Streptomyces viridochromogenes]
MDPGVLGLLIAAAAATGAALSLKGLRNILASIFRSPRKTSVIVEVDGKRVELRGATPEEAHAALESLLAQRLKEQRRNETALGGVAGVNGATALSPRPRRYGDDRAQAAAGGEVDD